LSIAACAARPVGGRSNRAGGVEHPDEEALDARTGEVLGLGDKVTFRRTSGMKTSRRTM
jgi:hypothetical protein